MPEIILPADGVDVAVPADPAFVLDAVEGGRSAVLLELAVPEKPDIDKGNPASSQASMYPKHNASAQRAEQE